QKFTPLPQSDTGSSTVPVAAAEHVMPYESLQHPLSVYDQLLGVS
ncbi:IS21 family transposase, partial [Acinetobacter johnsonii]|nr:IS21 family transposase [Acinetobacter johnsonii]